MGKISQNTIKSVSSINIVDVIGSYIHLKKQGGIYRACCPFHNEKTPSFIVNQNNNFYKCFGCGEGGDVISFVMKYEALSFYDTITTLCDKYKIELKEDGGNELDATQLETNKILEINKVTTEFFTYKLPNSLSHRLIKERGLSDEVISLFQIGHTSSLYSQLYKYLIEKGFTNEEVSKYGLCRIKADNTYYDTFRDRTIFPIHNSIGKVVGFSARRNIETMQPKYINTSENRVFKKSKELFGLYFAKKHITEKDEAIVVEGATDVISLFDNGVKNTVGTLGTAFTTEHATTLKRYTQNIVILYDGDNAGLKATFNACEELLKAGMNIYICPLPKDKDPDNIARELKNKTNDYIQSNKIEFIKHRISLLKDFNIIDKVKLAKELIRMINLHPDKITRDILLQTYNKEFGFNNTTKPKKHHTVLEIEKETNIELHLIRIFLIYLNEWNILNYFNNIDKNFYPDMFENKRCLLFFEYINSEDCESFELSDFIHNKDVAVREISNLALGLDYNIENTEQYDIESTLYSFELKVAERLKNKILLNPTLDYKHKLKVITKHENIIQQNIIKLSENKNQNILA